MKQIAVWGLLANMALPMFSAGVVRQASYYPEGNAFVCVNGNHRYTRALYGSMAEWRVETSDRPIFATYKKNQTGNIRFRISYAVFCLKKKKKEKKKSKNRIAMY